MSAVATQPRARRGAFLLLSLLVAGVSPFGRDAIAQELGMELTTAVEERQIDLSPPSEPTEKGGAVLSIGERVEKGRQFVETIDASSEAIQNQLQVAKQERDVVRVLCLNDKLNQVNVAQRSARDRLNALQTAAERADADRTRHEYTVLEVLADRVRVLVNESNQCVGEETGFIGEAEVSVSVDPNLPEVDTGFGPDPNALPPLPNISSPIE